MSCSWVVNSSLCEKAGTVVLRRDEKTVKSHSCVQGVPDFFGV